MMVITHLAAFTAGAALGLIFFAGLWLTLSGLHRSSHPGLRVLGSLMLRLALVLGGLYLIADQGQWTHVLAATVGFTVPRPFMVRRVLARHDITQAAP